MHPHDLFGEAVREVRSRNGRPFIGFFGLLLVLGTLVAADLSDVRGVFESYNKFVASGATTMTATSIGAVSGSECDRLSQAGVVAGAGAIRTGKPLRLRALPDVQVPFFEVTPGFAELLAGRNTAQSAGLILSKELAEDLSARIGTTLVTQTGAAEVAAIFSYPDDGRAAGLGWAALSITPPTRPYDQCWVDIPSSDDHLTSLPMASLAGADSDATLAQLNSSLGSTFDFVQRIEDRPTRLAPLAAFLGSLIVVAAMNGLRRIEIASALHVGVTRRTLASRSVIECMAVAVPACLTALAAGWCFVALQPDVGDTVLQFLPAWRIAGAGLVGALVGSLIGVLHIRERDLYRHYKSRS
ncbi:hypothetical protein [Microbacterium stercoris]|uniref:Uncharacterized protein n=1 Tax=Microbacterium stercoris TaxID=2820289 RepID=A0A939QJ55_9MICO|nr:hypothetical protein [Microbacterium stercoris]MBO3663080.1 hypothetical protein [Microbacterium stercoris]